MAMIWGRLTSLIAGIGISRATSVVIEPLLEPERQQAWLKQPAAILDPGILARLTAQGLLDYGAASDEAQRNGFAPDKFASMVQNALVAAPMAEVLDLWRRGQLSEALVDHALAKAQIEPQYWDGIKDLYTTRVPADLLAFAHQRGVVPNPTDPATGQLLIPVSPPTTDVTDIHGNPSPIQQDPIAIDVLAEFQATGWDFTRAAVNARSRGLPPAPGELLQLVNRGTISTQEYYVGIGEGDTRNEWRDYLLTLKRRLLTPHDYAELYLRGWIDQPTRDAGAALSGMEAADTQLLYQVTGRPTSLLTITKGLERGATYNPLPGEITDPYLASVHQSNIRPEWYDLAIASGKVQYPPLFQTVSMLTKGTVTPETAAQWLLFDGYAPDAVSAIVDGITGAGTTASPAVKSAQTKLRTAAEKAYLGGASSVTEATSDLEAAGVTATDIPLILAAWDQIKAIEARTTPPAAPIVAPPSGG